MTCATFVTEQLGLTLEQVPTMPTQCGAHLARTRRAPAQAPSRPHRLRPSPGDDGCSARAAGGGLRAHDDDRDGRPREEVNKRIAQVKAEGGRPTRV